MDSSPRLGGDPPQSHERLRANCQGPACPALTPPAGVRPGPGCGCEPARLGIVLGAGLGEVKFSFPVDKQGFFTPHAREKGHS